MKKILILVLLALGLVVAGCSDGTDNNEKEVTPKEEEQEEEVNNTIDREFTEKWKESNAPFLSKRPTLGDEDATITIVEFGDYKCPYCGKWEEEIFPWLKEEYIDTGIAKFTVLNYPFLGPDSNTAAYAGESIFQQNPEAFWEYFELMYSNQGSEQKQWATKEYILDLVKDVEGIDLERLEKDIDNETGKEAVQEDRLYAMENKINSTPTIFINGYHIGNSFDKQAISSFIEAYLND